MRKLLERIELRAKSRGIELSEAMGIGALLHVDNDADFQHFLELVSTMEEAPLRGKIKIINDLPVTRVGSPKQYRAGYTKLRRVSIEITANKEYSDTLAKIAKAFKNASSPSVSVSVGYFDGGKRYLWKQLLAQVIVYYDQEAPK